MTALASHPIALINILISYLTGPESHCYPQNSMVSSGPHGFFSILVIHTNAFKHSMARPLFFKAGDPGLYGRVLGFIKEGDH
jgi:hypothetical protein